MKKPAAPKTVKILHLTYKVGFDLGNPDRYGEANHSAQTISIAPKLTPQQTADTFLHEVLHAIYNTMDLGAHSKSTEDPTPMTEENVVRVTTAGILTFWRDNPEAMNWLRHLLLDR